MVWNSTDSSGSQERRSLSFQAVALFGKMGQESWFEMARLPQLIVLGCYLDQDGRLHDNQQEAITDHFEQTKVRHERNLLAQWAMKVQQELGTALASDFLGFEEEDILAACKSSIDTAEQALPRQLYNEFLMENAVLINRLRMSLPWYTRVQWLGVGAKSGGILSQIEALLTQ